MDFSLSSLIAQVGSSDDYPHPPLAPGPDETLSEGDPMFAEACREDMRTICEWPLQWDIELFTTSPQWGLIWRADFSEPTRPVPISPTRVMRWVTRTGDLGTYVSVGKNDPLVLKT